MTNVLLAQVASAKLVDQTEVKAGVSLATEGPTIMRFIGYVEAGYRPTTYKGKVTGKAMRAYLFFELMGKLHITEDDEAGTLTRDGKLYRTQVFRQQVDIKLNEKANYRKLFMKMRDDDDNVTHMAQCLSKAYRATIVHNSSGEGDKKRTYANITNADKEWTVGPAVAADPESGEIRKLNVPEATRPFMLLLWDQPTKEQWDSLFIDGSYTKANADGTETEVSKNWIQAQIVKDAVGYENSPLHDLLSGLGDLNLDMDSEGEVDALDPDEQSDPTPADALGDLSGADKNVGAAGPVESENPAPAPETKPAEKPKEAAATVAAKAETPAPKPAAGGFDPADFAALGLDI